MLRASMSNGSFELKSVRVRVISICVMAALCFIMPSRIAHAKPPLGRKWSPAQQISIDEIDHSAFDALLRKYVDSDGYVNYTSWKRSSTDRRALENYLAHLSRASLKKSSSHAARLAFWINAYNAVTIEGILQVYPTSSIRNHTAKFIGYNIWKELPLQVGRQTFSLEQMEHQILRKMGEPRIHFAIVCASVGCPRLRNEAYVAEKVDRQLAENARDFFSRSKNLRVDAANQSLSVSSILDWFGSDFGRTHAEQFRYLKPYLPAAAQKIATNSGTTVRYLDYDWSLNDQARRRTASRRR